MQEIINTFGLDLELLITQILNFAVVLFVMWYFLYRPTMNIIDERQQKIKKGLDDADNAKKNLREADQTKMNTLTEANEEAERIVADSKKYAEGQKEDILAEAREKSERTLNEARAKGEETKKQFLQESKEEVARMSVLGAESILREKIETSSKS